MVAGCLRRVTRTSAVIIQPAGMRLRISNFLRDIRGGATSFAAIFIAVMTVGAAALIVDHNWLIDQRDTLKYASDAAAIAATIEMTRPGVQSKNDIELKDHLRQVAKGHALLNLSHLSGDRLKTAKDSLDVKVKPYRDSNTVDVIVSANLGGTLFSRHLPIMDNSKGTEKVEVAARVEGTSDPVEVVLAIDISKSMQWTLDAKRPKAGESASRMEIVKGAAKSLVDILGPNAENRIAVGLVPWQAQVRLDSATRVKWSTKGWAARPISRYYGAKYGCKPLGTCRAQKETRVLPPAPQTEEWSGCLDEHRVDGGLANLPAKTDLISLPGNSAFAQGIYASHYAYGIDCPQRPLPQDFNWQYCYGTSTITGDDAWNIIPVGPQYLCENDPGSILPLTADASDLVSAIENLKPVGSGTYSALGLLWGQRLLTHSWKDVWGDSVHPVDPEAEGSTGARKAIVLLTDGEDSQCSLRDPTCDKTDVGIAREDACEHVKAAGIEIFVIAAMQPDKVSETLGKSLSACSSQKPDDPNSKYVFLNNTTPEDLETAFADIANQLKVFRRVY